LDALLEKRESEEFKEMFTNEAIFAESVMFLIAGTETTSGSLAFVIHALAYFPEIQEKLYQEIIEITGPNDKEVTYDDVAKCEYLKCVVSEVMRHYPTATGSGRVMERDTMIGEHLITKDTYVFTNFSATFKDAKYFENPEEFRPERFENEKEKKAFIPFGGGKRICIGKGLALTEVHTVIMILVKNFRLLKTEGMKWPIDWVHTVTLHPLPFKIDVEKRNN